jgi:hypothetical protein
MMLTSHLHSLWYDVDPSPPLTARRYDQYGRKKKKKHTMPATAAAASASESDPKADHAPTQRGEKGKVVPMEEEEEEDEDEDEVRTWF